jgi:flagellar hook assembly protein FlgD
MVARLTEDVTAVPGGAPAAVRLMEVAPNPFNPRTTIALRLDRPGPVEVAVHDLAGRRLAVLADRHFAAGRHTLVWRGTDEAGRALPSGTYHILARSAARGLDDRATTDAAKVVLVR